MCCRHFLLLFKLREAKGYKCNTTALFSCIEVSVHLAGSFQSQDSEPQPLSALCPCTQMPGVIPPGSWGVSESLSLDHPCCSELLFANLSYYLLLSASSQAWPVPSWCWWLCSGGSGWGRTCAGSLVRSWMARWPWSQQCLWHLWHLLPARLAGGTGSVVPTQDSSHCVVLNPGCSSLVSAADAAHAPLAALLPFPCSVLGKACLSLGQTRKSFYPQPARRFVQIPEAPAPCRWVQSPCSLPALPSIVQCGQRGRTLL